jgi:predicted dehydrogenase
MVAPSTTARKAERIRLGMVGGGEGAFIGAVHRIAARLDDQYVLLAGALSSTPEKARRSGRALGLAEDRIYDDHEAMARAESQRADGIEAVVVVTPNHVHAPVARAFLEAGIHVICDKPVTVRSEDARQLAELARRRGLIFAVTHNYSAYPMVRMARELVRQGRLGDIRVVQVEYAQDWLTEPVERSGEHKQAAWRTDPAQAGGGAIGDIGSHAWHLADYVSGLALEQVCAELSSCVPGRGIDDNVQVMMRYAGGARGSLWASQVAPGHLNDLRLRVFGSQGGLEWRQEHPNQLRYTPLGQPTQLLERAGAGFLHAGQRLNRLPGGHPEGYLEAFASLYADVAAHLVQARAGGLPADPDSHFPTIDDGLRGVQFIEAVQHSARQGGQWVPLPATA